MLESPASKTSLPARKPNAVKLFSWRSRADIGKLAVNPVVYCNIDDWCVESLGTGNKVCSIVRGCIAYDISIGEVL
jgi:hypothetical protein